MRIALVHDWLTGMRGGEQVLLSLVRLFPDAPIFTLLHIPGALHPEIETREIHTSIIQRLPLARGHYRHYLPLFPTAIARFDLSGFDLVISSSHCVAKGARVAQGARHLCYCHTPMRYVWDRFDDYFGPGRVSPIVRPLIALVARRLRAWDVATARGVDTFVANSRYVAGRIQRYYGREAEVLPPPVDTDFFTPGDAPDGGYDLIVSALVPYKRLELALDAYRASGRRLLIVGTGPEAGRLRAQAPAEVQLVGAVDRETLRSLYRGCRALLMPGIEDAGIVPLEAMACGRPVVAFAEGGAAEMVVPDETGILFHQPTAAALRAAVDSLTLLRSNALTLRRRAEAHARQVFETRFRRQIETLMKSHSERTGAC